MTKKINGAFQNIAESRGEGVSRQAEKNVRVHLFLPCLWKNKQARGRDGSFCGMFFFR